MGVGEGRRFVRDIVTYLVHWASEYKGTLLGVGWIKCILTPGAKFLRRKRVQKSWKLIVQTKCNLTSKTKIFESWGPQKARIGSALQ